MAYPTPKPTAIKELEGNVGKQKVNRHEPKPRTGSIQPPAWLAGVENGVALQLWEQEAPEYYRLGLLTVVDREPFARFCVYMAEWYRLTMEIAAEGEIVPYRESTMKNQKCALRNEAFKNANQMGQQFGWTPSSRTKIEVNPSSASNDDLLKFIKAAG